MAVEALRREIREELGEEIRDPVRLGVFENDFEYSGEPGHEVVLVYASFANRELCARPELPLNEPIWDGTARWIDFEDPPAPPLCPDGLIELLRTAI